MLQECCKGQPENDCDFLGVSQNNATCKKMVFIIIKQKFSKYLNFIVWRRARYLRGWKWSIRFILSLLRWWGNAAQILKALQSYEKIISGRTVKSVHLFWDSQSVQPGPYFLVLGALCGKILILGSISRLYTGLTALLDSCYFQRFTLELTLLDGQTLIKVFLF